MKSNKIKALITVILTGCMLCAQLMSVFHCTTSPVITRPVTVIPRSTLPRSSVAIVQASVARAADIDYPEILRLVRQAVELAGGFKGLIKDGDTVVLKPNLVTISDYTLPGWRGKPLAPEANGTTTDYRITRAAAVLVREVNPSGKIYVIEGSSVSTPMAFRHHRYTHEYIPEADAFLAIEEDSRDGGTVAVEVPGGLLHKSYTFNKKLYAADILISLPCLKNHWHAIITGAVKNLSIGATPANVYGANASSTSRLNMVNHMSLDLHYWIHDYYMARPADFVIMDGLQGVQNGPTPSYSVNGSTNLAGDQMNMRLIVAGRDGVAVDTIEALLMGWDPLSVPYLVLLGNDNVGNTDPANIDVPGKSVDAVRKVFKGKVLNTVCPGRLIDDSTAPVVVVQKAVIAGTQLKINLETDADLRFIRLFLNGESLGDAIDSDFSALTIELKAAVTAPAVLLLEAYDKYLNVSRQTITLPSILT